jgi:hypothetical protein
VGWAAGKNSVGHSVGTFEVAAIPTRSLEKLFDGPEAWLKEELARIIHGWSGGLAGE